MKLFHKAKDGGPDSKVTGYWLIESKRFFSIALLRFDKGSREAFHTHAFNAWSVVLKGELLETLKPTDKVSTTVRIYKPFNFAYTARECFHRVFGVADVTWVLTLRGPWCKTWKEYLPQEDKDITLSNGRVEV